MNLSYACVLYCRLCIVHFFLPHLMNICMHFMCPFCLTNYFRQYHMVMNNSNPNRWPAWPAISSRLSSRPARRCPTWSSPMPVPVPVPKPTPTSDRPCPPSPSWTRSAPKPLTTSAPIWPTLPMTMGGRRPPPLAAAAALRRRQQQPRERYCPCPASTRRRRMVLVTVAMLDVAACREAQAWRPSPPSTREARRRRDFTPSSCRTLSIPSARPRRKPALRTVPPLPSRSWPIRRSPTNSSPTSSSCSGRPCTFS